MHGTGMWIGAMMPQSGGAHVVTLQKRSFDAHEMFQVVQEKKATLAVVVGDSFVKPMIRALDEAIAKGTPYDASSLKMIASSGVMWTSEVKEALLERIEHVVLLDAMGSSEGSMGTSISMKGLPPKTAKFAVAPTTKVFTDDDREVVPGSGEIGKVAAGGAVPLGYYKDPEKSSKTFRTINGVRYSFPGDMATVEADGSLTLLGRGSQVINSGGEKIFPEEVENALKAHPEVFDAVVVGIPDDRWGERVAAVVQARPGTTPTLESVQEHCRAHVAGYKVPRQLTLVDHMVRSPAGKSDYRWAKQQAMTDAGIEG
jgi:fatty-acyl-CoA synthase